MPTYYYRVLAGITLSIDDFVISFSQRLRFDNLSIVIFGMARRGISQKSCVIHLMFISVQRLIVNIECQNNTERRSKIEEQR